MAHGQAEAGALARRLGGEERIEHPLLHLGRNSRAIVADPDLDLVAEILGCRAQGGLEVPACALLALGRGVEPVRDQVEQDARDLLRIEVYHAGGGIERARERHVERGPFGARAVIRQIEAFLHDRIDIDRAMLAGTLA